MGRQPAVLIIARHGARQDQADREWSQTATEPWNSPLSYGGWIQCQSLGVRIATELQNLDNLSGIDNVSTRDGAGAGSRPRKRRKITIHSSPFLRCVQTSIAIAAGIRQCQEVPRVRTIPIPFPRSSLSRPPLRVDDSIASTNDNGISYSSKQTKGHDLGLAELRLDSWLGEWLTSGYYEGVPIPPPSSEIVENAKCVLKQPPEEIKGADLISTSVQEYEETEWMEKLKDGKDAKIPQTSEKTGLRAMAAKGHSMPRRNRTMSMSTNKESTDGSAASDMAGRRPRSTTYSPPVPMYSIAPRDTIPIGFVAHARDACVEPDFEWDSEKSPLEWGDGGKYEEEWSMMHRRFHNGLQKMLAYYEMEDYCNIDGNENDPDEDLVLILVTHQAGCNALIRLVTGAPALHDVGTASLTLAVRKPGLRRQESSRDSISPTRGRRSLDLGLNEEYDMKILASSDHLRSGSIAMGFGASRTAMSPAFGSRRTLTSDSLDGFSLGDPIVWRTGSQSNLVRSSSMRGHAPSPSLDGSDSVPAFGLWSMRDSRSDSISSDTSIDPRSNPLGTPKPSSTNLNGSVILEDEAVEDWTKIEQRPHHQHKASDSSIVDSPVSIENQSIWQPPLPHAITGGSIAMAFDKRPVRSPSTRLSGNSMKGTGLWGSPVVNSGGVKEGTPHSRSSFGMSDAAVPMWGTRQPST